MIISIKFLCIFFSLLYFFVGKAQNTLLLQAIRPSHNQAIFTDTLSKTSATYWQAAQMALTMVENKKNLLPIINLENQILISFSNLSIHQDTAISSPYLQTLSLYTTTKFYTRQDWAQLVNKKDVLSLAKNKKKTTQTKSKVLPKQPLPYPIWLVTYHANTTKDSSSAQQFYAQVDSIAQQAHARVVLTVFGEPNYLPIVDSLPTFQSVILAYEDNETTQKLAAQVVFGAITTKGRLPQKYLKYPKKWGIEPPVLSRLQYTLPELAKFNPLIINKIDSVIIQAIRQEAFPSCQILVAHKGKVFLHKAYGFHAYDSTTQAQLTDIYDLASITKVAAGTVALMKLYELNQFDLNRKIGLDLPFLKRSNKQQLVWREVLAHQAQLPAGIAGWRNTLTKKGELNASFYSKKISKIFPIKITDSLFTNSKVKQLVAQEIKSIALLPEKKYLYSDLPFILTTFLVPQLSKQPIDEFVRKQFYESLGANSLVFNPLTQFKKENIVPTEFDSTFRKQQIHGTVHDETAALLGGVSGHAGLFGNANDLAKLFQFLLQKGEYGGKNYLQAHTVLEFTRCQYCWEQQFNMRGLGFHRPLHEPTAKSHTAAEVSQQSFGHSGFTGTYAWVDTEAELVYIFLSNRVYPTRKNEKLMELNVRTTIQQLIYNGLK